MLQEMDELLSSFGLYLPIKTLHPVTDRDNLLSGESLELDVMLEPGPEPIGETHTLLKFESTEEETRSTRRATIHPGAFSATAGADSRVARFVKQWRMGPGHNGKGRMNSSASDVHPTRPRGEETSLVPSWMFVHKLYVPATPYY